MQQHPGVIIMLSRTSHTTLGLWEKKRISRMVLSLGKLCSFFSDALKVNGIDIFLSTTDICTLQDRATLQPTGTGKKVKFSIPTKT